jgi:hypothetical protein
MNAADPTIIRAGSHLIWVRYGTCEFARQAIVLILLENLLQRLRPSKFFQVRRFVPPHLSALQGRLIGRMTMDLRTRGEGLALGNFDVGSRGLNCPIFPHIPIRHESYQHHTTYTTKQTKQYNDDLCGMLILKVA